MKHFVMGKSYSGSKKEVNTEGFYNELEILFKKYNLSISHEDDNGAFILEEFDEKNLDWLKNAMTYENVVEMLNKQ